MTEGVWPKADGDMLYASEVNNIPRVRVIGSLYSAGTETNTWTYGPMVDINQYAIVNATYYTSLSGASARVDFSVSHGSKGTDWTMVGFNSRNLTYPDLLQTAGTFRILHQLSAAEIAGSLYLKMSASSAGGVTAELSVWQIFIETI